MNRLKRFLLWLAKPLLNEDGYAAIPYIVMAAATAASAYASYSSGKAQQEASEYNAKVAENQAKQAQDAAKIKAENYAEEARRRMASNRAHYAASGVTMERTPLLVMMSDARTMEKDLQRIKYGGDIESTSFLSEAGLNRMVGKQAYQQGMIGAGVSLLSGASKMTNYYYQGSK